MNNYTLGAAMIVKDEMRCIDRCLKTIVPHLDEVVIVDTGSTDGTLEQLHVWKEAYPSKVKVFEIPWSGHFADMRNKAHALVESDFILIIDADEWIPAPNRAGRYPWRPIRRALAQEGHRIDGAYFGLYNYLPGQQITTGDYTDNNLRIVHNNPNFRWFGTVHNQIQRSIIENPRNGKEPLIATIGVTIEHDGYNLDSAVKVEKYKKRLGGLIQEISIQKKRGADDLVAYFTFQLANGYYMCKMFDESLATFRKLKWDNLAKHNQFNAAVLASSTAILKKDEPAMNDYTIRLMELQPLQPISLLQRGIALFTMQDFLDAYVFVATGIALNGSPNIKQSHFLDEEYCNGVLAEIYFQTDQPLEAIRAARTCLKKYPTHPRMIRILSDSYAVISAGLEVGWEDSKTNLKLVDLDGQSSNLNQQQETEEPNRGES